MKLTPEQKAFYEYGKAVESFRSTIHKIRKYAIYEFGEPYSRLTKSERKCLISAMDLAGQIHTVRQKRAACRAINSNRSQLCAECLHLPTEACRDCNWEFSSTRRKMFKSLWEPRKEGE